MPEEAKYFAPLVQDPFGDPEQLAIDDYVTFESRTKRLLDARDEGNDANNTFKLPFRLPRYKAGKKETDIVIFVNGFADRDAAIFFSRETGLAEFLAQNGVASTMVPLPFHLNRVPQASHYKRLARLSRHYRRTKELDLGVVPYLLVAASHERLYLGYRQVISDIAKVTREILTKNEKSYREWFADGVNVHVAGHSLGGLACLSTLMKRVRVLNSYRETDQDPESKARVGRAEASRISSCTLLSSGGTFLDLNPGILFEDEEHPELIRLMERWENLRSFYYSRVFEREKVEAYDWLNGYPEDTQDADIENRRVELSAKLNGLNRINTFSVSYFVFERLVLGLPWPTEYENELKDLSNKTLAIIGGADNAFSQAALLRVRPEEQAMPVLRVPLMKHRFAHDPAWRRWGRYVTDCIARFIIQNRNG